MSDPAAELRHAVAELAARGQEGFHLTEDDIADYHAGALPPAEAAKVQAHLLACRECTEHLLGLEGLATEGEAVPPAELAAAWQRMRARLPTAAPRELPSRPASPPHAPRRRQPVWLGALAASLLVAAVGLGAWVASLRRTVDELSRPQADTPVVDLFRSPLRGGREVELPVVTLAPDVHAFLLVLNPADARAFPRYEITIDRAAGGVVWRGELRRNEAGSFTPLIPRALVPDGSYEIHLWGLGTAGRESLGDYGLKIVTRSERR